MFRFSSNIIEYNFVILMDFVTQSCVLPVRIYYPLISQRSLNIFEESKCSLDLYLTKDNGTLLLFRSIY